MGAGERVHLPELVLTDARVEEVAPGLAGGGRTLFVVDPFNAPALATDPAGPGDYDTLIVDGISHDGLPDPQALGNFDRVVAVGGCSALDAGRFYAAGGELVVVPTILSTSCISSHISVVRRQGDKRSLQTTVPQQTVVPLGTILQTPPADLVKWSASGFGDLFANLSASVCHAVASDRVEWATYARDADEALQALDWVLHGFDGYNDGTIRRLATHLHRASVDVVRRGSNELSAGFEHWLYEALLRQNPYRHDVQTHGILVALGSLLVLRVFEHQGGPWQLSDRLQRACAIVGLPVTSEALLAIGIHREHVAAAVESLAYRDHFVTRYVQQHGFGVYDEVFGVVPSGGTGV
jgi:glycerol dehydrogenase-like iron-containing ADH family enzyme